MTLLFQILEGPHDVRVRMKAVGICGSDVHYLKVILVIIRKYLLFLDLLWSLTLVFDVLQNKTMRCADFIGHECAGVIEEVRR